jgi:CO/xanthine dehydrogenase Mo-binding subunit
VSASGGLVLAWHARAAARAAGPDKPGPATLGYFVRIEADGTIVIGARGCEIGQGVKTSLPKLIAEELDADWSKVRVEQLPYGLVPSAEAPGVAAKYGPQGAGGSMSVNEGWADLRQAGARDARPGSGRRMAGRPHLTFGGYAAHAIEVSTDGDGGFRIERCICAVDVGQLINPLGVEAQMMSGTIDGISTARNLGITIEGGRVREGNFDSYPLLTMKDAPDVEVVIVASDRPPAGAGEMGIPTAAPALTNAIFAATGRRIRSLPIRNAAMASDAA